MKAQGVTLQKGTGGQERYRVPASTHPPPERPGAKFVKARPSINQTGQHDSCYAGACEQCQNHNRQQRLELLLDAQDSVRSADDQKYAAL